MIFDMSGLKKILANSRLHLLFSVFAALLAFLLPESCPLEAKKCFAIAIFAGLLWALEIVPLYVTSLLVIILEILFLSSTESSLFGNYKIYLSPFASPVIILFLGGFILAAVFKKYKIDKEIASKLINLFGSKPYFILLGFLITTAFLSMWLSNTATTAMMLSIVTPLLASFKKDDPFKVGLAIAIAFGANIGGIATPIGSPPNAIAIGMLADQGTNVKFIEWLLYLIPLSLVIILITSLVLYFMFKPHTDQVKLNIKTERLPKEAVGVLSISLITIFLWLSSSIHGIPESVIALFAVTYFSFFGFIDKHDLQTLSWDILILIWGGLALGKGLQSSGFAEWFLAQDIFAHEGFVLMIVFAIISVLLSSFISNTVAANLLIPIALNLQSVNQVHLAIIVAISSSFAMVLPISTPPNTMVFSTGIIPSRSMLKAGPIISILGVVLLLAYYQIFLSH